MEGQFQDNYGSHPAQGCREALQDPETGRSEDAGQFANGLLGDDSCPDPLFFEESWTLGVDAAVERFQQRQKKLQERERQSRSFRDFNNFGSLFFVQEREWCAEHLPWAQAAQSEGRREAGWPLQASEEASALTGKQAPREWERSAADDSQQQTAGFMTLEIACHLLGVTAACTREQIKAAYHRMASQWHPDRFQERTEEMRRFATEHMAAINEAYSMIRNGLPQVSD